MKFKTKLYIGFGSKLLLMIIVVGFIMNILADLHTSMNEIVRERYQYVKLANTIRFEMGNTERELFNLVLGNSNDKVEQKIAAIETSTQNANEAINSLERIVTIDQVKQIHSKLKTLFYSYRGIEMRINELVFNGKKNEAVALLGGEAIQTRIQLFQLIDELKLIQEDLMEKAFNRSNEMYNFSLRMTILVFLISILFSLAIQTWAIRSISARMVKVSNVMASVASSSASDQLPRLEVGANDEIGDISTAFNSMTQALEVHAKNERKYKQTMQDQIWLDMSIAEITTMYQGVQDIQRLAQKFITKLAPMVDAGYGVFYIRNLQGDQQVLRKLAAYALIDSQLDLGSMEFRLGEGLVGQCAIENRRIDLNQVPDHYIRIASGIGQASPCSIVLLPVEFEDQVVAVIELAAFQPFTPLQLALLDRIASNLGITITSIENYMRIENLLAKSQAMTEELQSQSEELQLQQEELKSINEKLEEQNRSSDQKAKELEKTKAELEEKARQVELASKYKSEFLANMSHELRTPLNSLLILAQMLAKNNDGNLKPLQVEYAETIHSAGNDLLQLINDILDLSKVESGKVEINSDLVDLRDVRCVLERQFLPVARDKGLDFKVSLEDGLPEYIETDEQRLQQILQNLLSNAFKFTESGSVSLHIRKGDQTKLPNGYLLPANKAFILAFSVTDTGIGIPQDKQALIFEAFQQADGTTSRKYGGTGLGLSICRKFAELLEGVFTIESVEGKGSTFTLYLPASNVRETHGSAYVCEAAAALSGETPLIEQTALRKPDEKLSTKKILIADDDMRNVFALTTVLETYGMEVIFSENGRDAVQQLRNNPDVDLVLMDMMMPEMDGYEAMREIRLMLEYQTLPIIAITAKAMKYDREKCIEAGASDYISKPIHVEQLCSLLKVWLYR